MDSECYTHTQQRMQTRTIKRKCLETGEEFELSQTRFGEKWFPDIKYCDKVLDRMEQEFKKEQERQIQEKRRELGQEWIDKNVPPLYRQSPDRNHRSADGRHSINWKAYDKALSVNQSMLLIGGTRKGKTRTAMEIVKREAYKGNYSEYLTAERMAGTLGEAMTKSRGSHNKLIDYYSKVKMLVIDDLGKENISTRVQSDMFEIFNTRFEYQRLTIITTNWNGDALITRYPDEELAKPLVERFREFCTTVRF